MEEIRDFALSAYIDHRKVILADRLMEMRRPSEHPRAQLGEMIEETHQNASIHRPAEYVGAILPLCMEKRECNRGLTILPVIGLS